ncbi:unnamed protein product, partial [Sphacelaria rigidula]
IKAPDLRRAFLATSEGREATTIRFGTAPRLDPTFLGQSSTAGVGSGGRVYFYDVCKGEAIIRSKPKGFTMTRRARDPEVARTESVKMACVAKTARYVRAPASTVGCSVAVDAETTADGVGAGETAHEESASATHGSSDGVMMPNEGDPDVVEMTTCGRSNLGVNHPQVLPPTSMVGGAATATKGQARIVSVSTTENETCAHAAPAASRQNPRKVAQKPGIRTPCATEIISGASERGRGMSPDPRPPARSPPSRTESEKVDAPEPLRLSPNDAILSQRARVRAVVFPRPHTHHPRRKHMLMKTGGMGVPGPGQYDVMEKRTWERPGRGVLSLAPKRTSLTGKPRQVVELRRMKDATLGGPGEYDITR